MVANLKLLAALQGCNLNCAPPVWLMRQAGRYMPSYQRLRKANSLKEMFTNSELIEQVTLLPIQELQVDAAIIFSDILLILDTLGFGVDYTPEGIQIERPMQQLDLKRLQVQIDLAHAMSYLPISIKALKSQLQVPLIGFSAAPWTLASYAIDGPKAASGAKIRQLVWTQPKLLQECLEVFTYWVGQLIELQIEAGVGVIQLFDSHTHLLCGSEFEAFAAPFVSKLLKQFQGRGVPFIYFTRASELYRASLLKLPKCCLSIDWQSNLTSFREQTSQALQGNLNPWSLLAPPHEWKPQVARILEEFGSDPAFIFNLGHGILPQTPWDNVRRLVDIVRGYGKGNG